MKIKRTSGERRSYSCFCTTYNHSFSVVVNTQTVPQWNKSDKDRWKGSYCFQRTQEGWGHRCKKYKNYICLGLYSKIPYLPFSQYTYNITEVYDEYVSKTWDIRHLDILLKYFRIQPKKWNLLYEMYQWISEYQNIMKQTTGVCTSSHVTYFCYPLKSLPHSPLGHNTPTCLVVHKIMILEILRASYLNCLKTSQFDYNTMLWKINKGLKISIIYEQKKTNSFYKVII